MIGALDAFTHQTPQPIFPSFFGGAEFARALKSWRTSKEFSQRDAAEFLGISKRTLENWEQERATPRGYAVSMFQKVNVPILGIIENMSHFLCPSDGQVYHIFGKGGGEHEAKRLGVPLLGQIPIEMSVREAGDEGHPIALEDTAKSASSKVFHDIAAKLRAAVPMG